MIYLDNASTTKMFEECLEVCKEFSCNRFFNPSALSSGALEVSRLLAKAENYILSRLGAKEGNILFTGCATESNNLAIRGSLRTGDWEYVFSVGEHPSVFNLAKKLQLEGFKVHFIPLLKNGQVDYEKLQEVLNERTRLVSVMHVSNETGAVNDLQKISTLKKAKCPKAILHVDGVQGFMKIPFSLRDTQVDLYSFSGHKFHGPKGVGGLYVKNKAGLKNLFEGGGQQYGLRSGTENVSAIMQMCKAIQLIDEKSNYQKTLHIKDFFNQQLVSSGCARFGDVDALSDDKMIVINDFHGSPYIENLVFQGVKGETILHALDEKGIIVGLGSACSSKKAGNRVLQEIGFEKENIISSVRISFNAYLSDDELKIAAKVIAEVFENIKERVL